MSEKLVDSVSLGCAEFNFHSCRKNCLDRISECTLKIILYVNGSDDGVIIWD